MISLKFSFDTGVHFSDDLLFISITRFQPPSYCVMCVFQQILWKVRTNPLHEVVEINFGRFFVNYTQSDVATAEWETWYSSFSTLITKL